MRAFSFFFRMAEKILRSEPKYPMHVVPQCWQIFNQNFNVKRGLFFLDGPDWYQVCKYSSIFHLELLPKFQ